MMLAARMAALRGGTDLLEEGAQAKGVANCSAEARFGVEGGEFADCGTEAGLEGERRCKFSRRLGFHAGVPSLLEYTQHFRVQPGSKLRVVSERLRLPYLQRKGQPTGKGANPVETKHDQQKHQCHRKDQAQVAVPSLPLGEPGHSALLHTPEPASQGLGIVRGILPDVLRHLDLVSKVVVD